MGVGYAFLEAEVKFWSKVDFTVESGLHVLTTRKNAPVQYQRQLPFVTKLRCARSM